MKKTFTLICLLILTACSGANEGKSQNTNASDASAAPMVTLDRMRFHCQSDSTDIDALLKKGAECGLSEPGELMSFYADKLMGTPYVAHTLEGDTEMLTINIHQLDCTTFVETLYALTTATLHQRPSWREYANTLENIRYRHGQMGDYSTRLHYMSDWLTDNIARDNVTDLTSSLPGVRYKVKTLDFMTTHRDLYPSLKSDDIFKKVKNTEMGYRNHRFPYIPKGQLSNKQLREQLHDGDMVGLVTNAEGLDISHLGIIRKDAKGNIYLLDASMSGKKVQLEAKPLHQHLAGAKSSTIGVRLWRYKKK